MAIGPLDYERPIQRAGNWTIHRLGGATPANYRRSKNSAQRALRRATKRGEREVIGSMISECEEIATWLETGRRPGSMRGAEKRYVTTWDPAWLDAYHSPNGWSVQRESRELTDMERFKINEAMRELSDREKQCFLMYHVDGMSEYDIALELHLGRSTVQEFMKRAKRKIEEAKMTSLFLME